MFRKRKIIEDLIMFFISFSEKARREGLLSLEDSMDNLNKDSNNLLRNALQLVIDGTDADVIKRYCDNHIENTKGKFNTLLLKMIKEGTLAIQYGNNTRLVAIMLISLVPYYLKPKNFNFENFIRLDNIVEKMCFK